MTSKNLDKEKTKEDVIAIKNLRLEILEKENQKQEKLLGLYRQLVKDLGLLIEYDTTDTWDGPKDYEYLEIDYDSIEALNTYKQIKELENEKEI